MVRPGERQRVVWFLVNLFSRGGKARHCARLVGGTSFVFGWSVFVRSHQFRGISKRRTRGVAGLDLFGALR